MTNTRIAPYPGDPDIDEELVRQHGIDDHEYGLIKEILGREPTFTELGIFSALWSEHCGYKHSRRELRKFPTEGPQVIQGPGENAGVLRLGDGWAVAFKIESHNHPSAVEPYEGAATGVGGILRDVFTMGARPVALLNSLRFGSLDHPRNRYLFAGVTRGIGDYGNCVGVPTIGGEVDFSDGYSGNPLINAMCIGILREDDVMRAVASGVGNVLISVGARTGRDGIHGASFASEELSEETEAKRPQVQVGDPFTEKLLIEASLELIASGDIIAIQDMGAAGITSSSAEMAARGGVGVEIDASRVPVREPNMTPYEILLSESQERMLVVASPDKVDSIADITKRWELDATVIGSITDDGLFRVTWGDEVVAEIPGVKLVDECPLYTPDAAEDPAIAKLRGERPEKYSGTIANAWKKLVGAPAIASKRWVHEQYDSTVQAGTIIEPGANAGLIRIPGTNVGIAAATDCNSRYMRLDPYEGAKAAVAEAARNVASSGARPIGITNCLNFGSPKKPYVYFQFIEACRGIKDACRALNTPVTGGNVSFYNESPTGAIPPTPVIGMIGVLDDVGKAVGSHFVSPGHRIVLVGVTRGHLGGSSFWAHVLGETVGHPPPVDLDVAARLVDTLVTLADKQLVASMHDLSDGGLAVGIAEACFGSTYGTEPLGATLDLTTVQQGLSDEEMFFGEDHNRIVMSVPESELGEVLELIRERRLKAYAVGEVGEVGANISFRMTGGDVSVPVTDLRDIYEGAIPGAMSRIREN